MDNVTSIIQLFLEAPDKSLLIVPNIGTQAKLLLRMASIHFKRIVANDEDYLMIDHPKETRIIIVDVDMLAPSLVVWIKHSFDTVVLVESE
jgi:hypothetical protein